MQKKSTMNHVSMSSIEPANNNNNAQAVPRISNRQPGIKNSNNNENTKVSEYNDYGGQVIKVRRNSKRAEGVNKTSDSMVFLKQPAETAVPHTTTNAQNPSTFKLRLPLGEHSEMEDSLLNKKNS